MKEHIPKISNVIVLLSMLFLPIAGCQGENINGFQFLFDPPDRASEAFIFAQALFVVAIIGAIVGLISKTPRRLLLSASAGVIGLVGAFLIVRNEYGVEPRIGGLLAILAFVISAISPYLSFTIDNKSG